MKYKHFYLFLFFTLTQLPVFAQYSGRIFSNKSEKGVAYASMFIIDEKTSGTISDSTGYFSFTANKSASLRVTAVGFHDTLIPLASVPQKFNVYLREKIFTLPEITITPTQEPAYFIIGAPWSKKENKHTYEIKEVKGISMENGLTFSKFAQGIYEGSYTKVKKKEINKQIDSIEVFVPEKGAINTLIGLRILASPSKVKGMKGHSAQNLQELLPSLLTFKVTKSGWHTIDLTDYNIRMPQGGLFILFTVLDQNARGKPIFSYYSSFWSTERVKLAAYSPKKNMYTTVSNMIVLGTGFFSPMIAIHGH